MDTTTTPSEPSPFDVLPPGYIADLVRKVPSFCAELRKAKRGDMAGRILLPANKTETPPVLIKWQYDHFVGWGMRTPAEGKPSVMALEIFREVLPLHIMQTHRILGTKFEHVTMQRTADPAPLMELVDVAIFVGSREEGEVGMIVTDTPEATFLVHCVGPKIVGAQTFVGHPGERLILADYFSTLSAEALAESLPPSNNPNP